MLAHLKMTNIRYYEADDDDEADSDDKADDDVEGQARPGVGMSRPFGGPLPPNRLTGGQAILGYLDYLRVGGWGVVKN